MDASTGINKSRLRQDVAWRLFDKIWRAVVGIAAAMLLARGLGPEQFGVLAAAMALMTIVVSFSNLGMQGTIVHALSDGVEEPGAVLRTAFGLRAFGATLGAIALPFLAWLTGATDQGIWIAMLFAFSAAMQGSQVMELWRQSRTEISRFVLPSCASLALGLIGKWWFGFVQGNLLAVAAVVAIETTLPWLLMLADFKYRDPMPTSWHVSKRIRKALLQKSMWLVPSALCAAIYLKADQLMLERMIGGGEAGVYAAAARLSEAWYMLPPIIVETLFPLLTKTKIQKSDRYRRALSDLMTTLSIGAWTIALLTMFIAPFIVTTLFGTSYASAADILMIHIFAAPFIFVRAVMSKWMIIENILHFSLATQGIAAVSNIVLNLILIPQYGGIGAAWATLISYSLASFPALLLTPRTRPMGIDMLRSLLVVPALYDILKRKQKDIHARL